jgi:hypothetical protein
MNDTRSPMLTTAAAQMHEAVRRMEALTAGLSDEQANFRPAPKKWSINECLEHINLTNRLYVEKLEPALAKARARGLTGGEPYGNGTWIGRYILNNLRQGPQAPKVPAPGAFKPRRSNLKLAEQVEQFRAHAGKLAELAGQAEGLALGKVRFGSPVLALFRMTAAQIFEITHLHSHRHLNQAERVKQAEGYPAA